MTEQFDSNRHFVRIQVTSKAWSAVRKQCAPELKTFIVAGVGDALWDGVDEIRALIARVFRDRELADEQQHLSEV